MSDEQAYVVKTIKFGLVLFVFALSVYARIFREDMTENFTKFSYRKEKTHGTGVEEILIEHANEG